MQSTLQLGLYYNILSLYRLYICDWFRVKLSTFSLFLIFTISLSFAITHLFRPPPLLPLAFLLPVAEVVSVMAVGRLPAAGEILINSLFICVELRAAAF